MPKKRVTFKIPLVKRRRIKGGSVEPDSSKMTCVIHAAWCGHCQSLMEPKDDGKSIWQEAKEKIGDKCIVKEYEESENSKEIEDLKSKGVNVDGYPTIFKMDNGNTQYFKGDRTADEIYKFAVGEGATSNNKPIQMGGKRKRKTARRRKSGWFW